MAGPGTAQAKLDAIVRTIAGDMVAEVCSCYVMRPGEVLELFATEGLRPEAVHNTRLRVGEGLIGVVAATALPLALSDAQAHPDFAYRPETGEEIYHSLLGVPLLRGGRVVGVLAVQNRTRRHYSEDDTETLQTVAMIVAELAATSELIPAGALGAASWPMLAALRLEGTRLNGGLAKGIAVLHEPRVVIAQLIAEDPAAELRRVRGDAPGDRRDARRRRCRQCRRASRRARSLSHVRRRRRLGAPYHRGGAKRPHRRSRGAKGAG
jgi:phosphotransferase system enzyme I (PtsP)